MGKETSMLLLIEFAPIEYRGAMIHVSVPPHCGGTKDEEVVRPSS